MSHKIDRTSETNVNMQGCKMTIVAYRNNNDIDVLFNDYNCIKEHMTYHFFKKGQIKNPMFPSVCGVGYSGCKGVSWLKRLNKWQVVINVNKKSIYLGIYSDLEEAIAVRKEAEKKYFGEFTRDEQI